MHAFHKELQKDLSVTGSTHSDQPHAESDAFAGDYTVDNLIIESKENSANEIGIGQAYRKYRYARLNIKMTSDAELQKCCADTGCGITLGDRDFIKNELPDAEIRKMATLVEVSGIGIDKHRTDEYIIAPILIPGKIANGSSAIAKLAPREIHIVDNLRANILIGMDIMTPEGIDILASKRVVHITSCGLEAPIEVLSTGPPVRRVVSAKKAMIIPPQSVGTVAIHHLALPERDFLFEPCDTNLSIYAGLVDNHISSVLVKNESEKPIKVPRNMRLGEVIEAEFDGCYHISSGQEEVAELATRRPQSEHQGSWIKRVFKKVIAASAIALLATNVPSTPHGPSDLDAIPKSITNNTPPAVEITPTSLDYVLPNGVTTYGNIPEFTKVINEFPSVWKEEGFADLPEHEWMRIPLRSDWEEKAPKTARVYPMGEDSKRIIDETFDKLHQKGRIE